MNWKVAVCMPASEENLKVLSEIGIKGIEIPGSLQINPFMVSKEDLRRMRELLNSYEMSIVASNVIYPSDFSHTSSSELVRNRSMEYTHKLAEVASEIECPILVWGSGRVRNISSEISSKEGYERNLRVLKEAAKAGEEFDVKFAVEPLPKNETNFVNTMKEALELVNDVNSDFVKAMADIRHMIREEYDLIESLRIAGRNIIHVHLADDNSKVPGRGIIDFYKLLKCFRDIGYEGAMSIEARIGENPKEELNFAMVILKRASPIV
ncbi:MAG: sugar phosphate isomerase/epimerase family protein [Thermoproteota archaeon]